MPYSTCESLAMFVFQVIVSPDRVMPDAVTLEIAGAPALLNVVGARDARLASRFRRHHRYERCAA